MNLENSFYLCCVAQQSTFLVTHIHWNPLLTRLFGLKGCHHVANGTVLIVCIILSPAHLKIQFSHGSLAKTYRNNKFNSKTASYMWKYRLHSNKRPVRGSMNDPCASIGTYLWGICGWCQLPLPLPFVKNRGLGGMVAWPKLNFSHCHRVVVVHT